MSAEISRLKSTRRQFGQFLGATLAAAYVSPKLIRGVPGVALKDSSRD